MKLRILAPLDWSISRNLVKWAKKLKIPLAGVQEIESVIVIADGIPDDIVCLILCHKLNGKQVVGITKPKETLGINAISTALEIARSEKIRNLVVILDQERKSLEDLWEQIEEKLKIANFKREKEEERNRTYSCSFDHNNFKMVISVNGLDVSYTKHTIEDHLIEFSKKLLGEKEVEEKLNKCNNDPKDAWQMLREKHEFIYNNLINTDEKILRKYFPQHLEALISLLS